MVNDREGNKIKSTLLNIAKTLVNQKEEINKNLEGSLRARLERNNYNEVKYIGSLKFNVIFYKVSIRNRELLLAKWIENGSIPDKKTRDAELDKLVKKCRDYVQNGTKSSGKTFNERDLKSLLAYQNLAKDELREKLEAEYKALNVYNDVLSIFINDLSIDGVDDLSTLDIKEVFKTIKLELSKATNFIVKSFDDLNDNTKNENVEKKFVDRTKENISKKTVLEDKFNEGASVSKIDISKTENKFIDNTSVIENKFLDLLKEINDEELSNKMKRTYEELSALEEIKYYKGYGFGKEGIKEYIVAVSLLNLVNKNHITLLKGAIRLLIGGEFGATNFKEFIQYIVTKKINISEKIYEDGLYIIEENHKLCINNELSERRFKDSKFIDMEEYIYILENTDEDKKYRRDSNEFDDVQEVKNESKINLGKDDSCNSNTSESKSAPTNNEHISNMDENVSSNKNSKGKKIAIICGAVLLGIGIGVGGLAVSGAFNNDNVDDGNYNPPMIDTTNSEDDYEVVTPEVQVESYSDDDYFIADSNARYLTLAELQNYSVSQLGYIRNEIFARHGHVFDSEKYQNHFNAKAWYSPDYSFDGNVEDLNEYEKANIKLIKSLESSKSPKSSKKNADYEYVDYDEAEIFYCVYSGAFKNKDNAENHVKTLDKKSINSIIIEEDGFYKVRIGSAYNIEMAEEIIEEVSRKSIDTCILGYSIYYDEEIDNLEEMAFNGYMEEFEVKAAEFKDELEDEEEFVRYLNLLNKLYEKYM